MSTEQSQQTRPPYPWEDMTISEEERVKAHDAWFFIEGPPNIPPETLDLLQTYSRIPPAEVVPHVQKLREKAYKIHRYPCIGLYTFLKLDILRHPAYVASVLPRLTAPNSTDIFLDVGTCFGQDVRKLIHDGVPVSRVYGSDVLPEFIDAGYELFRDRDSIPDDHFLRPADLFDSSMESKFCQLDGKVSMLHLTQVMHLFDYADQLVLAKRLVKLLRPGPGGLIFGQQNANLRPGEYPQRPGEGRTPTLYRHNEASFTEFWERVGREVGEAVGREPIKFKVQSKLRPHERVSRKEQDPDREQWRDPGFSHMWFTVERL
ncbi:MAG: hypothetical protein Q9227_009243 [Pyrenula ochraceoflavens]